MDKILQKGQTALRWRFHSDFMLFHVWPVKSSFLLVFCILFKQKVFFLFVVTQSKSCRFCITEKQPGTFTKTSSHLKTSWSSSVLCILSYRWLNRCIFMVLQSCFKLFLLFCPPLSPTAQPFRQLWCRLAVLWHSWTPINFTLHTTCCSVRLIWIDFSC